MWRIKYYSPFLLLVFIVSFINANYFSPIYREELVEHNYITNESATSLFEALEKYYTLPVYEIFKKDLESLEIRKKVFQRLKENNITIRSSYLYQFNNLSSFEDFEKFLHVGTSWGYRFNYDHFYATLIIFGLFPVVLFEVLRLIYLSFSKGRFSESYITLSAKNVQLKYRLVKIEKKKSNEELKRKLAERDLSEKE